MAVRHGLLKRADAALWYRDVGGTGPPIVLTHGAGLDHTFFDHLTLALSHAGHRTVSWDLRGHGESRIAAGARMSSATVVADLTALVDELDLDRPVLVGHSLGGNVSQAFARANPGRVRGLIVMDSTWNTGPLTAVERASLRLATPTLRMIPASILPRIMARASAVTPAGIAQSAALFAGLPKAVFLDVWRTTVSFVDPDSTYRSPVPLALLRGAQDLTGNIATAMPRWARTEGIRDHSIVNAGHNVTLDAPEAVTQEVVRILSHWRL